MNTSYELQYVKLDGSFFVFRRACWHAFPRINSSEALALQMVPEVTHLGNYRYYWILWLALFKVENIMVQLECAEIHPKFKYAAKSHASGLQY